MNGLDEILPRQPRLWLWVGVGATVSLATNYIKNYFAPKTQEAWLMSRHQESSPANPYAPIQYGVAILGA